MAKYRTIVSKQVIEDLKNQKSLTNEDIADGAKKAGYKLNKQALVDVPDGKGNPRLSTIDAIAAGLDINPLDLLKAIIELREAEKVFALMCLNTPQMA